MEPSNRTRVCSIVFVDIVKYSTQHVAEQIVVKENFNSVLRSAIENVAENERIILDTGDGAAICFLGDPEEAFFAAWSVRNAVLDSATKCKVPYEVRIGVNLGPVRVVKDINGNLNVLGDGINDAQRVMSFAASNQVLVSRSFFEVVSKLSNEYAGMLQYFGTHKDKHVREHTVFQVVPLGTPRGAEPPAPPEPSESPSGAMSAPQGNPPPIAEKSAAAQAPQPGLVVGANVSTELERSLAVELGPIAKALVRKISAKASSLEELKALLAAEISSDKSRKSFLDAVRKIH